MNLTGRRVLITGASRGIGEALAIRFTEAGARVALVARSADPLRALAARLDGTAYPTDLCDPAQVHGLIDRVESDGGPVDVLVGNAGIDRTGSFSQSTADDIESVYRLNLVTPVELCRQAVPRMLGRSRGHIVNMSSLSGVAPFPGMATYSSSKAGLSAFTAALRLDLRGTPVRTTLVELGPVSTDLLDSAKAYGPTRASFERSYRTGMITDTPVATVATAVVEAVTHDRRHVVLPRRAAPIALLVNAPRRAVEAFLVGIPSRSGSQS
ncbi:MAG: short-chain dehydrogenase [Acidimicrobiales bacterium]|nr:MAG: short-chain dehydrogenase [Acidimicrobiales bacterium]